MGIINKTVNYKGEKIKVKFQKTIKEEHFFQDMEICKKRFIYLKPLISDITFNFQINGKIYDVRQRYERAKKQKYSTTFEGFLFTKDNDKKIIEHIISKYGL